MDFNTLEKEIKNKKLFAHITTSKKESLYNHFVKTKEYYELIVKNKNLLQILNNLFSIVDYENEKILKYFFEKAIYLHDVGKINPSFQKEKLFNDISEYIPLSNYSNNHSLLSAYIYICTSHTEIDRLYPKTNRENKKKRIYYKNIIMFFGYIISKHHSSLNDDLLFKDGNNQNFLDKLQNLNDLNKKDNYYVSILNIKDMDLEFLKINSIKNNYFEFYILLKILYSLLIASDYYATYDFMNDEQISKFGLFDEEIKKSFICDFQEDEIYKNIMNDKYTTPLNKLRNDIFKEINKNINSNINKNIFFLESPTGSGKTYNSINILLQLLKIKNINKTYYVFPFNNLIEQTNSSLKNIFKNNTNNIIKVNSISSIIELENNSNKDYLNKIFLNYPLSIISNVSFFNSLFGCNKSNNFSFYNFANSVIILDEIQNYNVNIWKEMINFFNTFSKLLNIKIIIMSATLPNLNQLLDTKIDICDLLPNKEDYYKNPLFKDRVKIDYSLLKNVQTIESIFKVVEKEKENYNKILIEFQNKQNCRNFFNYINNKINSHKIYEITSDDNSLFKQKIINKIKNSNEKIIIVSTQVFEAGVDVDFDLGLKEISILESEEQFLGRINRSCLKENCKAYFFQIEGSKVDYIYKEDIRRRYSLSKPFFQKVLLEKNFISYYKKTLLDLNTEKNKNNKNSYDDFLIDIGNLSFKQIYEKMRLIKNNNIRIYIPFVYQNINGYELWQNYCNVFYSKIPFSKKQIEISKLSKLIDIFCFNINVNDTNLLDKFSEEINGIYYLENHDFIDENYKLNRENLKKFLK